MEEFSTAPLRSRIENYIDYLVLIVAEMDYPMDEPSAFINSVLGVVFKMFNQYYMVEYSDCPVLIKLVYSNFKTVSGTTLTYSNVLKGIDVHVPTYENDMTGLCPYCTYFS